MTENRIIIRIPIQKMGADVPMSASTITALSRREFCLTAETMPRKVPRMTAIMIAAVASLTVLGNTVIISSRTGLLVE